MSMMQDQYYNQMIEQLKSMGVETTLEELKRVFRYKVLKKGEYLIHQGEVEQEVAFVCKGLMRYYYITLSGDDVTKHFGLEDDFTTSYASLIYQRPTAYNIVAEEDSHLLLITYEDYSQQIESQHKWERLARLYAEKIYNIKEIREASLLTMDAKERYKAFLTQYPTLESRVKQKHIATYLGIHPVSLSRLKKELFY